MFTSKRLVILYFTLFGLTTLLAAVAGILEMNGLPFTVLSGLLGGIMMWNIGEWVQELRSSAIYAVESEGGL